jgi:outer membrane protein assembly factor BamB
MRSLICIVLLAGAGVRGEEWSRFRGPNGSGIGAGTGYPERLDKDKNLTWRTPLRSGKSSPVLTARHIFLTAAEGGKLYTLCLDRATGKLLWERSVEKAREQIANRLNHDAAPSPVTDGDNVYSFFKDFGLVSYTAAGKERWRAPLGPFNTTMGIGASPVLAGNLVVVIADQVEGSYIAAFDRASGEMKWKTAREETEAWGSPLVWQTGNASQVLTTARGQFGAHKLADGSRTISLPGLPNTVVGSPVMAERRLFVLGYGSEEPASFAARLERLDKNKDGMLSADEYGNDPFLYGIAAYKGNRDGVITEPEWLEKQREVMGPNCLVAYELSATPDGKPAPKELWRHGKSFTGVIPSPLYYEGAVYYVKNGGILTAVHADTGETLKTGRITGALGGYSSSPVAADGKLYLGSEDGFAAVLRAGADWEVQSVTDLGEAIYATPALSAGSVFVRTSEALYRFDGGRR